MKRIVLVSLLLSIVAVCNCYGQKDRQQLKSQNAARSRYSSSTIGDYLIDKGLLDTAMMPVGQIPDITAAVSAVYDTREKKGNTLSLSELFALNDINLLNEHFTRVEYDPNAGENGLLNFIISNALTAKEYEYQNGELVMGSFASFEAGKGIYTSEIVVLFRKPDVGVALMLNDSRTDYFYTLNGDVADPLILFNIPIDSITNITVSTTAENTLYYDVDAKRPVVSIYAPKLLNLSPETTEEIKKNRLFRCGDIDAFRSWIVHRMKYPQMLAEQNIQGKVTIRFKVNTEGRICRIDVLDSPDPDLAEAVVQPIRQSPPWEPKTDSNGNKMNSYYMFSVDFKITQ